MNTHADKTQEKKSQSVANAVSLKKSASESTFQFVDNRPESVAQRKLKEVANNNPQALQLKAFEDLASRHKVENPIKSAAYNIVIQNKANSNQEDVFTHLGSNTIQLARKKKSFGETDEEYAAGLEVYNAHVAKGKKAWNMLQAVLADQKSTDVNTKAAFVERYGTTQIKDEAVPSPASSRVDDDGNYLSLDTGKKGAKESAYLNVVNTVDGVIIGGSNYANKDPGEGRLPNSEILYHQYKMAMEVNEQEKDSEAGNLSNLSKIVRNSIQGEKAITVLGMCDMNVGQRFQGKTFAQETDDFFAILGTDNGKSAAFLLKDHPIEVGWKNITNITASNGWIEINIS